MIESQRPFADGRPTAVFVFNALRVDAGRLTQTWLGRVRQFDAAGWATHAALINKDQQLERTVATLRSRGRLPDATTVHHFATRDRRIRPGWRAPLAPGESIDPRVGDWLDWLTGQIPGAVVFADSPAAYPYLASMSNPTVARVAAVNLIHLAPPEDAGPGRELGSADPLTGTLAPRFAERFAPVLDAFDAFVVMTRAQAADLRDRFGADLPVEVIPPALRSARASAEAEPAGSAGSDPAGSAGAGSALPRVAVLGALEATFAHDATIRSCAQLASAGRGVELVFAGTGPLAPSLRSLAEGLGIGAHVTIGEPALGEGAAFVGAAMAVWTGGRDAFPLGTVRSIRLGVPVVALDLPYGPAEQVTSPTLGRLVADADPGALAAAIASVLANPFPREAVRRAGASLLSRTDPDSVGGDWAALASRLSRRAWDPRTPTILVEGLGVGSRIMRAPAILASARSDMDAWSMDLPGTPDPAAWLTPMSTTASEDPDDEDAPLATHGPGTVRDLYLNLRSSLLAFSAHETRGPLSLELTDGFTRARVLSTAFEPRFIASRVGSAVMRREPDGSVVVVPHDELLAASSLDGGLLVRRTPTSAPDEVTHAVDWVIDIDWADLVPSDEGVAFQGTLRATGIAPAAGSIPAICVPDVGGFSRIVGTLQYTEEPSVSGLDWSAPVAGSIQTDPLVATTALARRALNLHVGFRGQLTPIGGLWTHGSRTAIQLVSDRGMVTLLAAAGGRVIAAPGRGRRARMTSAIRHGLRGG